MEDAEQVEGTEGLGQSRLKRSRTGCLTCRTRRRKCDEGKPQCQNCISKGFECRYAAAFQILGKNNFTPEFMSTVKYTKLKFVPGENKKEEKETDDVQDRHETPIEKSPTMTLTSSIQDQAVTEAEIDTIQRQANIQSATSPSADSYEFALHGLLALGSGTGGFVHTELNFAPPAVSSNTLPPPDTIEDDMSMAQIFPIMEDRNGERAVSGQVQDWRSISIAQNEESGQLPQECALELLRHYRYEVATWMDLCDPNQTFGCEVLYLAAQSTSVRYGIFALANKSLRNQKTSLLNIELLADMYRQQDHVLDTSCSVLLDALTMIGHIDAGLSTFWMEENMTLDRGILNSLLPDVGSKSLATSVYWLLVRLCLSVVLTKNCTIRIPLPPPLTGPPTPSPYSREKIAFQDAHNAVALCVDAAMYCQGDEDGWLQQRYARTRVEIWGTLVRGFEQWFTGRSQDFQAVIELYQKDGRLSEDEFPTIVFSGGAALFANQLCHTGMLLLLQNKPRFSGQANSNSPFMSPLWHSHRISGIAINNNRRECWDPCLLASLLVAARMATHQSQHLAIFETLDRVERLTGWNIASHLSNLKNEWQPEGRW